MTHRYTILVLFSFFTLSGVHAAAAGSAAVGATSSQPPQEVIGHRGNWVKKREWLMQARTVDDGLQQDVARTVKARTSFLTAFQKAESEINDFYQKKGFVVADFEQLFAGLDADIQTEKDRRIALAKEQAEHDDMPPAFYDVQIEAIEDDIARLEREVAQFKADLEGIGDLDASLTKRLEVLDDRIKEAHDAANQSAQKIEQMWWMVDDAKARDAFYQVQDLADRVSSIKTYVSGALLKDFERVVATISSQIEHVTQRLDQLEQRSLVVAHRASRLDEKKREEMRLQLAQESEEPVKKSPRSRKKNKGYTAKDLLLAPFELVFGCARLIGDVLIAPFRIVGSVLGFTGSSAQANRRRQRRAATKD